MNRKLGLYLVSAVAGVCVMGSAQAMPAAQITARVDDNLRATLIGNTLPEASGQVDHGAVSDKMPMDHAQILLHRSDSQEKALEKFIADLHNPKSASYHKWLSAQEFGDRYGVSDSDIKQVSSWLTSHGFKVNSVSTGKMVVDFSGNVGQVRDAFRTDIHSFSLNGQNYIANVRDPQIPAALVPAVTGVISLNTYHSHTNYVSRGKPALSGTCAGYGTCLALTPADFATIYDLNPLFQKGITGKGQTIVVVEDTGIGNAGTQTLSAADWVTFRNTLGLSGYTSASFAQGQVGATCIAPGITGDEGEATLDAEWASASAPNAAIQMVSCKDTSTSGELIAIENLVDSATPPAIVSISYGECESFMGNAQNAGFNAAYQQGVAEGTTVFVSSGDESATSCDADQRIARHGISVSGYTSTPYNVSVGGTDFGDIISQCGGGKPFPACDSKYWSATNTSAFGSAKSYIPEIPWDSSCASEVFATFVTGSPVTYGATGFCNTAFGSEFTTTGSGSGGPSGCVTGQPAKFNVVSGGCKGYAKPAFQAGVFGNPADGVRDIPDVSLYAANGLWSHFYVFCDSNGGGCAAGQPQNWAGAGGTSFSSPIFAGIMALIEQNVGARQGNANAVFYALGASEYGTTGNAKCNSSLGTKGASTCVFHDVTEGDFNVPCVGKNDCYDPSGPHGVSSTSDASYSPAYRAAAGWDYTTGLGTVDATNLVNAWPK